MACKHDAAGGGQFTEMSQVGLSRVEQQAALRMLRAPARGLTARQLQASNAGQKCRPPPAPQPFRSNQGSNVSKMGQFLNTGSKVP